MKFLEPARRGEMKTIHALCVLSLLSPAARAQDAAQNAAPTQVADAKRAGQDVPVPTRKKYVAPEYPVDAAAQGVRGIVILEVLIGEDGLVLNSRVTRSIPGLDQAAVNAANESVKILDASMKNAAVLPSTSWKVSFRCI